MPKPDISTYTRVVLPKAGPTDPEQVSVKVTSPSYLRKLSHRAQAKNEALYQGVMDNRGNW